MLMYKVKFQEGYTASKISEPSWPWVLFYFSRDKYTCEIL